MTKRILHVTSVYTAGVGRAVRAIVDLTPHHEHHLLWAGHDDPTDAHFTSVRALPAGHLARARAARERAREIGADLVHAHSSFAGLYTRLLPARVPVIYEPHCYKLVDPRLGVSSRLAIEVAERYLARHTEVVLTLSREEELIAQRVSPHAHTMRVSNLPSIGRARSESHPAISRRRSVVMAGRVAGQKDPAWFAAVARTLRGLDPRVELRWLGSIDEPDLADHLTRAGVHITGWLDDDELRRELTAAGVYLHCALYEGFPISVLDAAQCGAPMVVRDIPAFHGTGLVRAASPQAAARRALAILDDHELRRVALESGQQLLRRMGPDVVRRQLDLAYA